MKRKRLTFLILGVAMLVLFGMSAPSNAEVDVSIGAYAPLPEFVFSAPPDLVVIPGTYVYYTPDIDFDIFFYGGYWYRPYRGFWHRSEFYNGPWVYIGPGFVPVVLIELPPRWRALPIIERIPYDRFFRDWRRWEREGYWERQDRWREMNERWRSEREEWQRERSQDFEKQRNEWQKKRGEMRPETKPERPEGEPERREMRPMKPERPEKEEREEGGRERRGRY